MEIKTWLSAAFFLALTPELAKAEIRGLYGTHCLEGSGVSAIKDLLLREQSLEIVQTIYADLHCMTPSYDFSFSGPYDLDEGLGHLNYAYGSIKLQALDETSVATFNRTALCGLSDWRINEPREVSGLDCGEQLIPERDSRAYDRIRERSEDKSVQLGLISDLEDGLSEEARPSELESLIYYPK